MALDKQTENFIRAQAKQQVATLKAMGADLDTVCDGLAVALEEFCAAYSAKPDDVLEAVTDAVKDRQREAARAAARKADVPNLRDVFKSLTK